MRGRRLVLAGLLCACAGCAATDPLTDPLAWRPSGANEANLQAELADPADAFRGRQAAGGDGQSAAEAVRRLRADRVKALPDSGLSDLRVQGGGSGGAGSGGGAGGGGAGP
jgi:type IV pilus biogenesis protein CpaD/CtpE